MRASFLMATSIVAVLAGLNPGHAAAQQANEPASADETPDIIVTARKRSESLTDVPVAITAVTSQAIEAKGIASVADLSNTVPNISFTQGGGDSGIGAAVNVGNGLLRFAAAAFYYDYRDLQITATGTNSAGVSAAFVGNIGAKAQGASLSGVCARCAT
jgi:outer membrane receptor for monomeric catechols